MRTLTSAGAVQRTVERWRHAGDRIGVVPTMGALHPGHRSLLRAARKECDRVVMTLFVNPTQFGRGEDLSAYPRTTAADKRMARDEGVDLLFLPDGATMYPEGFSTLVHLAGPTRGWESAARPTHFDGVTTVVSKLWNITKPHRAYFGQKDAQQAAVVRRLAADLNFDLTVRVCPTVRERDGLALSSRNAYLSDEQRRQATCLHEALTKVKGLVRDGERRAAHLKRAMRAVVARRPLARLDYAGVVCPDSMRGVSHLEPGRALAVIAVFFGKTRLLDNTIVRVPA